MDSLLDADTSHRFTSSARRMTALSSANAPDPDQRSVAPSSVYRGERSVELADDEVRMLAALADTLLARLKAEYEAHAVASGARVDKKRWKAIKKREQLTVYKQKGAAPADEDEDAALATTALAAADTDTEDEAITRGDPSPTDSAFRSSKKQSSSKTASKSEAGGAKVPQLMLTGSVAGRVQDALYGLSSATSLAMKFRSSYSQDAVVDAQVLTTIEAPSVDEPFRFLGLKWALQNHASSASPSTSLFKKRDVVYLESTGTTALASGERVGFHIVHSVLLNSRARMLSTGSAVASASASSSVVRAKTSVGHLFRQRTSASGGGDSVDVFVRGYYDPSGGMLHFLAVNLAAEMLLHTAASSFECAQLKKLSWAAHQGTRKRRATALFRATAATSMQSRDTDATMLQEMADAVREVDAEQRARNGCSSSVCAICSRKYGKLLQRGGAACTICAQMVCSRCSVAKKLSFTRNDDSAQQQQQLQQQQEQEQLAADLERSGVTMSSSRYGGGSVKSSAASTSSRKSSRSKVQQEICQKAMNFCVPCIVATNKQSAAHVAVEEMLEQQVALAACAAASSSATPVAATPRQVLAMAAASLQQQQQQWRRTTRAGSTQYFSSTTPRFTYNSTATTPAAAAGAGTANRESKTPRRPKAFSTSSTASSTTSSVILYEEPAPPAAIGA